MFGVLVASGIDTLRAPTDTLDPAFIAYSVLLAPVIETAVMLALAAVLARLVPKHVALQIVLVAIIRCAHAQDWRRLASGRVHDMADTRVCNESCSVAAAVRKRRVHRH